MRRSCRKSFRQQHQQKTHPLTEDQTTFRENLIYILQTSGKKVNTDFSFYTCCCDGFITICFWLKGQNYWIFLWKTQRTAVTVKTEVWDQNHWCVCLCLFRESVWRLWRATVTTSSAVTSTLSPTWWCQDRYAALQVHILIQTLIILNLSVHLSVSLSVVWWECSYLGCEDGEMSEDSACTLWPCLCCECWPLTFNIVPAVNIVYNENISLACL